MLNKIVFHSMCVFLAAMSSIAAVKTPKANFSEEAVNEYTLPNILTNPQSKKEIKSAYEWMQYGRPSALYHLQDSIFGNQLPRPQEIRFELLEESDKAYDGTAIRKQYRIHLKDIGGEKYFDMLLYYPKKSAYEKIPVILCMNFVGNHTTSPDPEILLHDCFLHNSKYENFEVKANKAEDYQRGKRFERWPIKEILARGYAVGTCFYGQVFPDIRNGFKNSICSIYGDKVKQESSSAIAAWASGYSRMLDCVETIPELDAKRVMVLGHSRLGKTSLFAGACDERFAIVFSNNSGCMGSSPCRRNFGETTEIISKTQPHWFCAKFQKLADDPNKLPIDMHFLSGAIAPRPVYIAIASEDKWSDPKGSLISLIEAGKVYSLFGAKNLPTLANFEIEKPFHGDVGYHIRKGKHHILLYDWERYMDFADKYFYKDSKY